MSRTTFIDAALRGQIADPDEEIDRYIAVWHDLPGDQPSLHDWLGMTWEEYSLFVERPQFLPTILSARRRGEAGSDLPLGRVDGGLMGWQAVPSTVAV